MHAQEIGRFFIAPTLEHTFFISQVDDRDENSVLRLINYELLDPLVLLLSTYFTRWIGCAPLRKFICGSYVKYVLHRLAARKWEQYAQFVCFGYEL